MVPDGSGTKRKSVLHKEVQKMNNGFFDFVKTYWEEISEFFDALFAFVKALFEKMQSDETEE